MDDNNGKNPLVAVSAVLALFTALGVMVYVKAPLKGIRPPIPAMQERPKKIWARLWQDPFQAVLDQTKSKEGVRPDTRRTALCLEKKEILTQADLLKQEIKDHSGKDHSGKNKKITVLGVMVFGSPYEEEMENRLRKRYAVLSGLNRLGYVPEEAEHLSYVRIFQSEQECQEAQDQNSLSTILPFEWFVSEEKKEFVWLLWINDDVFQNKPLEKLAILFTTLQSQTPIGEKKLEFKLIGPAGSTTLLEMLKEIQKGLKSQKSTPPGAPADKPNFFKQLEGLEIYSATATAEDSILDQELKNATGEGLSREADPVKAKFSEFHITLHRTINSDKELAEELVEELALRGVGPDHIVGPSDHIALISEWDTFYGRSLPKSFEKAWKAKHKDKDNETRIHHFSYLRGIDGQLPGERETTTKGGQKNGTDPKEGKDIQKMEEPTGKSQYDYLRRLAERIYLQNQQLECQKRGKIKAIGVLGSDFYDKYLVLQALGQRFPELIFFTTDLDARLLHPAAIEWTRNLVVASGFGLQLREGLPDESAKFPEGLQGDLPPFRDVYQTSVYLATLKAFDYTRLRQTTDIPKPLIFEIGRHNVIDLTTGRAGPTTIHPPRDLGGLWGNNLIGVIVIIFLLLVLLWFMGFPILAWLKRLGQFVSRNPDLAMLIALSFLFFNLTILQKPCEEPVSLFEGVSVWPTAVLRLVAIGLSWYFFFTSVSSLQKSNQKLAHKFFGWSPDPDEPAAITDHSYLYNLKSWWPTRVAQFKKIRLWFPKKGEEISDDKKPEQENSLLGEDQNRDQVRVEEAWKTYVRYGSVELRLKRIIPPMIIYFLLCVFIIIYFGVPTTPVRGQISYWINWIILYASIISFLFLTFFVFDATRDCRRFITTFLGKKAKWEPTALARCPERDGRVDTALGDWRLIQLTAQNTEVVVNLIFYPFIVWLVLFVARLRYIDNWRTSIGLIIVISMSAVLAWSCAFMLRRAAEKLRAVIRARIEHKIHAVRPPAQKQKEILQRRLEEVATLKTGAFAAYHQNPVLQSLLVPIGGLGGVELLGFLSKLN